jgi:methyl-accepting chemotaxis protein
MKTVSIAKQARRGVTVFLAVVVISGILCGVGALNLAQTGLFIGNSLAPRARVMMEAQVAVSEAHAMIEQALGERNTAKWADISAKFSEARESLMQLTSSSDATAVEGGGAAKSQSKALSALVLLEKSAKETINTLMLADTAGSKVEQKFDLLFSDIEKQFDALAKAPQVIGSGDGERLLGRAMYLTSLSHLKLEEILAGDASESFDLVMSNMTSAEQDLQAMGRLTGSAQAAELDGQMQQLSALAQKRYDSWQALTKVQTDARARFGVAFQDFVAAAAESKADVVSELEQGIATLKYAMLLLVLLVGAVAAVVFVLAVLAYHIISKRFVSRLVSISNVTAELTKGNLQAEVPDWTSQDEIGALRDSVAAFRDTLQERERLAEQSRFAAEWERATSLERMERERLEIEKAEQRLAAEKQQEEARRTREHVIAAEIASVVAACAEGDFSKRLRTDDKEGVFAELCYGMNRIGDAASEGMELVNDALSAIFAGNLAHRMPDTLKGVFHQIAVAMNATSDRLGSMLASISASSAAVNASTNEIASATEDLARRTERNAATLEETAAALGQMSDSVRAAAQSALSAKVSVDQIAQKATVSQTVVGNAIIAMNDIRDSSEGIERILHTIEEIAFQTNLLALNAGVEAARAGESGRGFAVVASEVRALAQRSSNASREISSLIDLSRTKVVAGVDLVNESSQVLREIIAGVTDAAAKINEISQASHSTASGIVEISAAASELDKSTQMNAAMFEETSVAVRSLENETRHLDAAVSAFSVRNSDAAERDLHRAA